MVTGSCEAVEGKEEAGRTESYRNGETSDKFLSSFGSYGFSTRWHVLGPSLISFEH